MWTRRTLLLGLALLNPAPAGADLGPGLDAFVAAALTRGLGNPLIEVEDEPWNRGEYSLTLTRIGDADIRSSADWIETTVALKFEFAGRVRQDLLFTEVDINCTTEFNTQGSVALDFHFRDGAPTVVSSIELPIPEADVDCGAMSLPVQGVLEELVARNKPDWEEQLDAAVRERLEQLLR